MAEDKIIPEAATGAFDEKELNIINAIEQESILYFLKLTKTNKI